MAVKSIKYMNKHAQRQRENVHVQALIELFPPQKLRRHPGRGACVGVRRLNVGHVRFHSGQTEITHFTAEIVSDQQVITFEVAMNNGW